MRRKREIWSEFDLALRDARLKNVPAGIPVPVRIQRTGKNISIGRPKAPPTEPPDRT